MSDTRLEYHEILQVFTDEAEPVAARMVAKLADLARVKSEAAYKAGYDDGFNDGFDHAMG